MGVSQVLVCVFVYNRVWIVSDHSRVYRKYYPPTTHTDFLQRKGTVASLVPLHKPSVAAHTHVSVHFLIWDVTAWVPEHCLKTLCCRVRVLILHVFAGDSSEQDDHPSVRPYARNHVQPYVLNSTLASTTESSQNTHTLPSHPTDEDPLGPLPDNWEMAYTENGEVYFIE